MEWLAQWVRNLAFYFIFLSAVMNVLPEGEEKKYIRFFMGMLLVLLLLRPVLQLGELDRKLEQQVLADSVEEAFGEMMRETGRQEVAGTDYVKNACIREVKIQLKQLLKAEGYRVVACQVSFFDGELLELKKISVTLKAEEEKENSSKKEQKELIKNKLKEVYNIPEGNINISIQG